MSQTDTIKRIIPPIVSLALFMEAVDTTIINTAIPSMSRSLHVSVIDLKIALISYLLSLAIFIPISGWLADRYGTKKVFMGAIAVFTLSSLACGFATSLYGLVFARFIQGMGGALMIPVGRLIIVRLFNRDELITAMNRVIIPALIGPALGPLLGGVISEAFSWRWIFWVNIPFGIVNIILAYYWVENFKNEKLPPFDWMGFMLFGFGLAGLVFGFSSLSESGFSPDLIIMIFSVAIILLSGYAYYSTHVEFPVLRVKLFLARTFRVAVLGNLFTRFGFGGVGFLLPLFLQLPLGFSPESAGLMVALTAIGALVIKFYTKWFIGKLGFKKILLINTALLGVTLWLFMLVGHGTPLVMIAFFSFTVGIFAAMQFSAMNPLAYAKIVPEDLGAATSIMSVMQQVAMSFGVGTTALILRLSPTLNLSDFHRTFFILGCMTILSSALFLMLKKDDGRSLIHE
ncbi:MAG TPA: DHA2 family efflux MFS transporter permease subunit [Gammaproteobacteria bacterium]|nr:DHA2 family efflux MFS transporter permease subunit [Gammaproteobacteria bacterium]